MKSYFRGIFTDVIIRLREFQKVPAKKAAMLFLKDAEIRRRAVRSKEILEMNKNKSNTTLHDELKKR